MSKIEKKRFLGKCKCGAKVAVELEVETIEAKRWNHAARYSYTELERYVVDVTGRHRLEGYATVVCPECESRLSLRALRSTYNPEKKCSARCMGATRHVCECACGGANHGSANL